MPCIFSPLSPPIDHAYWPFVLMKSVIVSIAPEHSVTVTSSPVREFNEGATGRCVAEIATPLLDISQVPSVILA